jgi:uncharacterized membrane protein SpoIIM required for sporulation
MKDDTFTTCLGIFLGLALTLVLGTLADGWALAKIWNWFIPNLFHLTSLTLWQAIGVSLVFEIFTRKNKKSKTYNKSEAKTIGEAILTILVEVLVTPLLSVFIAWIVFNLAF